ncbi:hypothetical protein COBT_003072 [Conglomerata obtusa]
MKHTISVIGSGNWGTAIAKVIAENVHDKKDFNSEIFMWTFEEIIDDRKITEIINTEHVNVKYLPGITLPKEIIAVPDLLAAVQDADILVFVIPHQFVKKTVEQLKGKIRKDAIAVSLIKGIIVENNNLKLISNYIEEELGIECAVLMGANIADEVGAGKVSEGTLACRNKKKKLILSNMFNCFSYRIACVDDINGVELCGTLKNIVSLAYGISNGINLATNTKVAVLRNGLKEMVKFCFMFYENVKLETFFESAGIADLFVSSLSGRNFKCGVNLSKQSIEQIEAQMDGQKLQGTLTAKEIFGFLQAKGKENEFPLFVMVYKICYKQEPCDSILEVLSYECGCNK